MAILSFSLTKDEFLSGKKTVTRRDWADTYHEMWERMWDTNRLIHDAYDNVPRAGGKKIGQIRLIHKPYKERLSDMPLEDLYAEGGMCSSREEFYNLIGKSPEDFVSVIRFIRV
ncbi:MAG: hypothetical protein WBB69_02530 [Anaerolineales bacterium]